MIDPRDKQISELRAALEMVDGLIQCADVRMDKGPYYRFRQQGQHDAALAVRAALASSVTPEPPKPLEVTGNLSTEGYRITATPESTQPPECPASVEEAAACLQWWRERITDAESTQQSGER
jgi:hypothetical protein